jgi:outer membrane cobalamin receptor
VDLRCFFPYTLRDAACCLRLSTLTGSMTCLPGTPRSFPISAPTLDCPPSPRAGSPWLRGAKSGILGRPGRRHPFGRLLRAALACPLVAAGFGTLSAQEPPITLDTLEVQVGSRVSSRLPVLTRSIQILGREEIDALPVRSVAGLLEWATGVDVMARSPVQSDLSLRGAGFEQVVVLVDGVRMSDPQTGHHDLDLAVPLDRVDRVEVLRGPASALYGADAVGGVVNVVTKRAGDGLRGRVEGGSWGTARLSVSGGMKGTEGSSLQAGGEVGRSGGHREGTDYEMALLHVGGVRPLGGGAVSGAVGLARRDFGAKDFYAPYPSFERTRTYTSSLRWVAEGGGGRREGLGAGPGAGGAAGNGGGAPAGWGLTGLEAGAAFRRHEDEFILIRNAPQEYRNRHTSSQVGGDLLARGQVPRGIDLAVGGELFRDLLRSNSLGNRTEDRGALFGEAALEWRHGATLSLGMRGDWHEGFGTFLSPSLSGSWRTGAGFRARAAAGRSFRAPTWTERYYRDPVNVGREELDPERAWSGEVGMDVLRGSSLRLSTTGFVRRGEGLIDWARAEGAGVDTPWETRNVESATFRGVEVDVATRGPWETNVTAGVALLSLSSEEARGLRSKYALRPLRERITLGLERTLAGRVSLGAHAQRGRRSGEDAYHRLDLRAVVRHGDARLYLDALNLLDASYPDVTGAMAPGRALFLGLEVGRER